MCKISDFLCAKKLHDGTPYIAVSSFPDDHYLDCGFDARKTGIVGRDVEGNESELTAAIGTGLSHKGFAIAIEVRTRQLELIWNAIAAGSQAVEPKSALPDEISIVHD